MCTTPYNSVLKFIVNMIFVIHVNTCLFLQQVYINLHILLLLLLLLLLFILLLLLFLLLLSLLLLLFYFIFLLYPRY